MVMNGVNVKLKPVAIVGAIATVAATISLSAPAALSQVPEVRIDGSSTVYPITEAVAEEFGTSVARVTVGVSGTGGGFSKFCNGETDISNASRPIKQSEIEACEANGIEFIELPVAYDALSIVVNPENTWVDNITVEELRTLWAPEAQGTVTRWSQVRPGWPDEEIFLYGPGADSGTFDYFTEAIVGESGSSRGDFTASEDDNVLVQGVAQDTNALGYFGLAYYEENRDLLRAVPVEGVEPTPENVNNGTYTPLSRPLFIYVSVDSLDRPEVQQFIQFYLDNAPSLSSEVGYVALPDEAYAVAQENFDSRKAGSVFAGRDTVGVDIAELLRLETGE